jgi:undecaprenyl-diphosphatase
MRRGLCLLFVILVILTASPLAARAASGPFGIDHRVAYDNSGIWQRHYQKVLMNAIIVTAVGGSLVLGDQSKLGDTFWRSLDSMAVASAIAQVAKRTFQRVRPSHTSDPGLFFQGVNNTSFPSGEVTAIAGFVTPFVVAYGPDHPEVYALEALPLYDSIGRVKARGHWQSDVLVGWALGTAAGIWAARRNSPLILGWLPHGFQIGLVRRF